MNIILETPRLRLFFKTIELTRASFYGTQELEKHLGTSVHKDFLAPNYQEDIFPLQYGRIAHDHTLSHWSGFVVEKARNVLIGTAGFLDKPNAKGEVEIKFYIHPSFRGQGYATEILLHMKDYYLEKEEVLAILASHVLADNIPAIRVLEKMGMRVAKDRGGELNFILRK